MYGSMRITPHRRGCWRGWKESVTKTPLAGDGKQGDYRRDVTFSLSAIIFIENVRITLAYPVTPAKDDRETKDWKSYGCSNGCTCGVGDGE